jgi:hypothetical protein
MESNQQLIGNSIATIDLGEYGNAIVDTTTGDEIYVRLKHMLGTHEVVEVNLKRIVTMATFCAKQVFGRLYIELGPEVFFKRILLKDSSNELRYIITTGIKNALKTQTDR